VTIVAGGSCSITASQAGNASYAATTPVAQSFTVNPATQTIAFGALSNQVFGAAPFTVSATASSGLTVNFNSQTTSVCTVSGTTGSTVTLVSVGACTIQATQAGNTNYAAAPSVSQSFQVTPAPPAIGLNPASLSFTAVQGGSNPANQTVGISNAGGGALNWSALVTSGAFLSLSGTTSGANSGTITAAVSVGGLMAGTYNGNIQVTAAGASNTPQNISVTVTVNPSSLPIIGGVSNAAGGQAVVAPNTWVAIYGTNFALAGFVDDWSKSVVNGKLPTILDGVTVTIGGQPTYVYFVSSTQINVLTPDLGLGSMAVTVTTLAGASQTLNVISQKYSPAFFPWPNGQPVATHLDYSLAAKNGTFAGVTTIPAKPGETIILWGTGFGPTDPSTPIGVAIPSTSVYYTADPVTVTLGGIPASVYATALAPGNAGLYQVAVTIPASLPNGDYTLVATINGAQTPSALTLAVHD